jgi:hypothetical protein
VRADVFLTNMTDFAAMNGICANYFGRSFPARDLRDCDFRRFTGTPLRLLVTGFVVLAASNKCRMPCSNSLTALSKAPSCPTRTIATDKFNSNDGGHNTSTVPMNSFLPIKRAGSSPTPYPD